MAFSREAVPDDPVSPRAEIEKVAGEGRHMFWVVDEEPVSMAGIVRRTRSTAAIAAVYTPPAQRGRGFAGSVTAAVAERVFAEGKAAACLYTDLRNPASNRCYAKIGFKPVCDAWVYRRLAPKQACDTRLTFRGAPAKVPPRKTVALGEKQCSAGSPLSSPLPC
jgi:RimJ/RimL family protein N-acetyltransferase